MASELDVLKLISEQLSAAGIQYMLTGSFALAYYATPRMTRDLDIVVNLGEDDVSSIVNAFSKEFYVDIDDARAAVISRRMFNLIHLESGIKVDFIIRKITEYRQMEFERRKAISFGGVDTWIVSCEDLILSKLLWSVESQSDMQHRDVLALSKTSIDWVYLRKWAEALGVLSTLDRLLT
jgi:hypothetical protein